jgi:cysteine desulfurase
MSQRVYLDWNATAPLRAEAREAVLAALDRPGNPSSVHAEGRAARHAVEEARQAVAALVGAEPAAVTLTSGGTEANALALTPALETAQDKEPRNRLLVSAIEHPSVQSGGSFAPDAVERVAVDGRGVVDLDDLKARLTRRPGRPLVSVMLANNETGVVQPIPEVARLTHEAGGLLHVDAVQAAGKIPIDIKALGADLLTLSAHKLGGPKGAGALVRRDETLHPARPLLRGGGQERGLRAGTENVAGIAGFGAAARAAARGLAEDGPRMAALRSQLERGIRALAPEAVIFGEGLDRLPNTTMFAVAGLKAETALIALDLDGIAVSSGSACSSGKVEPSHVLAAMGVEPALAASALRVSLGWTSAESDIERFLGAWKKLAESLGKLRRSIAA